MEKYLPFLNGVTITAALGWFIWWKSTLHDEIVKPDIKTVNERIDFINLRLTKVEDLYEKMQDNIDRKIDKLQDAVTDLTKEVAELAGQIKSMQK